MSAVLIHNPYDRFLAFRTEMLAYGKSLLHNARQRSTPACVWQRSSLSPLPADVAANGNVLIIDVGGTHSKIAACNLKKNRAHWTFICDESNTQLLSAAPATAIALDGFFDLLLVRTARTRTSSVWDGVALIWSNEIDTFPLPPESAARGVGARICGLTTGSYQKDEWFIKGLRDGYDLSAALLRSLAAHGMRTRTLLVGNDTSFVLNALPGAQGAVVCSSGANCTALDLSSVNRPIIVNTEMGAHLKLRHEWQTGGDQLFEQRLGQTLSLEHICGGLWLPLMISAHADAASISLPLESLTNRTLNQLLEGADLGLSPSAATALRHVGAQLIRRSGLAVALLAAISVTAKTAEKIALDSALARNISGFQAAIENGLQQFSITADQLSLLRPLVLAGGEISVPMQGAGLSCACLRTPETRPPNP